MGGRTSELSIYDGIPHALNVYDQIRPQPSPSSPISPISPTHQAPRVQKARSTGTPIRRPVTQRHRRTQTRARLPRSGRELASNSSPPPPEFDFNNQGEDADPESKDEVCIAVLDAVTLY